ncbi:tetratricopeptide repeat protein [Sporosarcina sp. A2]|uniref:tetratricopeptide repeat protein n=1 Tax=Sporosarcina sp. A2 TaxID=3393449 RepID=UPI003D7B21B7
MKRKSDGLHKKGNMIVFPGTVERLLDQAEDALQSEEFEEAVRLAEQLLQIAPNLPEIPGVLAIALYETKEFEQAKHYATLWLQSDVNDYFEAMELYLAISMQLQDYTEVEDTIGALLDEGVVPNELKQKFLYLRELNGRLSNRFSDDYLVQPKEVISFDDFLKLTQFEQQQILADLERTGLRDAEYLLSEIVVYDHLPNVLRTVALVLLRQTGFDQPLVVRKFGRGITVYPAQLPLPGEDKVTQEVCQLLQESLDKDPTRLSLIEESVKKFAMISYPLGWGAPTESVVAAYENYSCYLFEGVSLPQTSLHKLIFEIDQDYSEAAE